MTGAPELDVRKFLRLTAPSSSREFLEQFAPVYSKLEHLYSSGGISTNPQKVMLMLDEIGADKRMPASKYMIILTELGEKDCMKVDRILQQASIIEPTIVFQGDRLRYERFRPNVHYTNRHLLQEIFSPSSGASFDLADPAAYSRKLPTETLCDLLLVPGSIHSALVRILQLSNVNKDVRRSDRPASGVLSAYSSRPKRERFRDAQTLAGLIYAYATSQDAAVQTKAEELARNYTFMFSKDDDLQLLELLKESLERAAKAVKSEKASRTAARVGMVIRQRGVKRDSRIPGVENEDLDNIKVVSMPGINRRGKYKA